MNQHIVPFCNIRSYDASIPDELGQWRWQQFTTTIHLASINLACNLHCFSQCKRFLYLSHLTHKHTTSSLPACIQYNAFYDTLDRHSVCLSCLISSLCVSITVHHTESKIYHSLIRWEKQHPLTHHKLNGVNHFRNQLHLVLQWLCVMVLQHKIRGLWLCGCTNGIGVLINWLLCHTQQNLIAIEIW